MIYHGKAPFLECSSAGDKRFSAYYARIKGRGNRSIEEIYQAAKVFSCGATGLSIKEARGKRPINIRECHALYGNLWDEYIQENPIFSRFWSKPAACVTGSASVVIVVRLVSYGESETPTRRIIPLTSRKICPIRFASTTNQGDRS